MKPKEQRQALRESFLDHCTFSGRAQALNKCSRKTEEETSNGDDEEEMCVDLRDSCVCISKPSRACGVSEITQHPHKYIRASNSNKLAALK